MYNAKEVAQMSGVSIRTLHHYDEIGLLSPKRNPENGYREYSEANIDTLQQILFLKEIGLPLKAIKTRLENPDNGGSLENQLDYLRRESRRIKKMIRTIEKTIKAQKGEIHMESKEKFEGFKRELIKENEAKFGTELREKYGEAIDDSNAKLMSLTEEEYREMKSLEEEIHARLESAVKSGKTPASEEGRELARLHKDWLMYTWQAYSKEAHNGLAEMYVADERFKAYYDNNISGCAVFLRDAILSANK